MPGAGGIRAANYLAKAAPRDGTALATFAGGPVLELSGLARKTVLRRADLTVRRGEILGIAGLVGAGRTELLRTIFGLDAVRSGAVKVKGVGGIRATPRRRISQGLGFLSEDRKGEGLALARSIL